ncbi:MAG: hypothetical protein COC09_05725 [Gammaproteobacteria bacterium]|nr:MAG: hypothetical protein COC09_05725 [Gammaproteobacteria bacterium]
MIHNPVLIAKFGRHHVSKKILCWVQTKTSGIPKTEYLKFQFLSKKTPALTAGTKSARKQGKQN